MFYIDLDELNQIESVSRLLRVNRSGFLSFYESDYFATNTASRLKERVLVYLKTMGIDADGFRIRLLTNVRSLGYIFNPVSFYFCFAKDGLPCFVVAEVGNTFRESKLFLIRAQNVDGSYMFIDRQAKDFYVSPFSDLDRDFEFTLSVPDESLALRIGTFCGRSVEMSGQVSGLRLPLNSINLWKMAITFPLMSWQVILLIHLQALLLWAKGVPFFSKQRTPERQTGVLNPYKGTAIKYEERGYQGGTLP
jgi:DUF1365 family protein